MKNQIKTIATLMSVTVGICLAPIAYAQEGYSASFGNSKNVSITAGVHITFPFGGKQSNSVTDRARFGLMLNITREYNDRNFYTPRRVKTNLLDLGLQFNGQPTMLMAGQDIYTPLFAPLRANEDGVAGTGVSKNAILIIAGGALAVGAAVAIAGGGDGSGSDNDGPDNDNDGDDS